MTRLDSIIDAEITLNGVRARVFGRSNDFATIAQLEAPRLSCDFSWSAVERIIDKGGAFFS